MSRQARGTFDVKLDALEPEAPGVTAGLGRRSIEKHFHGALDGVSHGEMLAFMTAVQGSAAYVALEKFVGTLDGRPGSFVLQHASALERGVPAQSIAVVPDSAEGELAGLRGRMQITITGGQHHYEFDYTLPGSTA